jgi:hypothetical protein
MMKLFLLSIITFSLQAKAADDERFIKKDFVILTSSKDYEAAKKVAEEASKKLAIKLDLRGLMFDKNTGLTFDKKTCLMPPVETYPCYVRRGKYDNDTYISIEYSSAYKEMSPGFYIAVLSGEAGLLEKARVFYKDAYLKVLKIDMIGE